MEGATKEKDGGTSAKSTSKNAKRRAKRKEAKQRKEGQKSVHLTGKTTETPTQTSANKQEIRSTTKAKKTKLKKSDGKTLKQNSTSNRFGLLEESGSDSDEICSPKSDMLTSKTPHSSSLAQGTSKPPNHTYTQENVNWFRVVKLLVDEGSVILREILLIKFKAMGHNSLEAALSDAKIKARIDNLNKPPNQSYQLVLDYQYKCLYSNKKPSKNIDSLDLSLIFCILFNVCQIRAGMSTRKLPDSNDKTLGADVCRLRSLRNSLYAHTTTMSMTANEFDKTWDECIEIYKRLKPNLNHQRIKQIKTSNVDSLEDCKAELEHLWNADREDLVCRIDILHRMVEQVHEDRKDTFDGIRDLRQKIDNYEFNLISKLKEVVPQNITDLLCEPLVVMEEKIKAMGLNEHTLQVGETLDQISSSLDNLEEYFKIMMISSPNTALSEIEKRDICLALGSVPWDIVIDLDYNSRKDQGLHDMIAASYCKMKDFSVYTHLDLRSITDKMLGFTANGDSGLWILINGCAAKCVDSCFNKIKEYKQTKLKLTTLLQSVSRKFRSQKKILFFIMVLSNESMRQINDFSNVMEEVCADAEETGHIVCQDSMAISMILQNESTKAVDAPTFEMLGNQVCRAPLNQIIHFLHEHFPCDFTGKTYVYPGNNGDCFLRQEEFLHMKPYITFLHKGYGHIDFTNLTEKEYEDKIFKERKNYLKGDVLTADGLYINERHKVYIERNEMRELVSKIKNTLLRKKSGKLANIFQLSHEPSSGGSTAIRHLLYTMRNDYPCVLIEDKKCDLNNIVKFVRNLYENSMKTVLIGMDGKNTKMEAESLVRYLENCLVKSLIVHVTVEMPHAKLDTAQVDLHIPLKLDNEEDKYSFRSLYEEISTKKIISSNVFLFGLLAFCEEFELITTHIKTCVEGATFRQKSIMKLTAFVRKYGQETAIPIRLLQRILSDSAEFCNLEKELGMVESLTIRNDHGVRLAHDCITEILINNVSGTNKKSQLVDLNLTMQTVYEKDEDTKRDTLQLLVAIFSQPKRDPHQSFSALVTECDEVGQEFAVDVLNSLVTMTQRDHFAVLLSRYFLWIKETEKAIEYINKALGISPGDDPKNSKCTDNIILYNYGNIYKSCIKKSKKSNEDEFLDSATKRTQLAISAFKKSQDLPKYNLYHSRSFLGEAQIRQLILELHFDIKCNGNYYAFSKFMEETSYFLKECKTTALLALDRLDNLIHMNKVENEFPEMLQSEIVKTKFNLLKLDFDKGKSIRFMFNHIESGTVCDIGSMVRGQENLSYGHHGKFEDGRQWVPKRRWCDLDISDLEIIFKCISKKLEAGSTILCSNYRDIILSMIYMKRISGQQKLQGRRIDLAYALTVAKLWVQSHRRDIEANFFYGLLLFVDCLERIDKSILLEALDCFNECRKLCESNLSVPHYTQRRFMMGIGNGLKKLVPYDRNAGRGTLQKFTGRQFADRLVYVEPYEELLHAKMDRKSIMDRAQQEPKVSFCLAISRDSILAVHLEYP